MKKILLTLSVVILSAQFAFAQVATNEPAKDFTLKDTQGVEHSLSDYQGKYVVLEWINHECPFVKKHYNSNNMQALQEEYTAKGIIWLSINSSAPGKQGHCSGEEAENLTQEKEANPTAVLLDSDGTVGRMYAAQTTPHMYIINPEGTLIYQGAIDSIPSADAADIAKAENYVKLALNAAMAGKPVEVGVTKAYGCSVKY